MDTLHRKEPAYCVLVESIFWKKYFLPGIAISPVGVPGKIRKNPQVKMVFLTEKCIGESRIQHDFIGVCSCI